MTPRGPTDGPEDRTERLALHRPTPADVPALHAILADPAVWTHYPALRHTTPDRTTQAVQRWMAGWDADGLGTWVARHEGVVVGYGGCSMLGDAVWNLGYRLAVAVQGRGLATELARRAVQRAADTAPGVPVVAYLLEHNCASAAVARKLGLALVHRGPDAGNPDPAAARLVFADRDLTPAQLAAARH